MRSARRSPSRLFGFVAVAALLLGVFATSPGTAAASSLSVTPVSSSQWGPDTSGYEHIVGEVQNTGTVTASLIEIDFAFYDASNAVVGSDYTFATVDPLAPG
ncbi:MAG: FxLYD domain-containing protein, partial [Nitrospiraceae bacterium]|nr:FxLYD domain-containing protein [Nitrospiraceae bacterium]